MLFCCTGLLAMSHGVVKIEVWHVCMLMMLSCDARLDKKHRGKSKHSAASFVYGVASSCIISTSWIVDVAWSQEWGAKRGNKNECI